MLATAHTVCIPEFPFCDRASERSLLKTFMEGRHDTARVMLVEAPGGIGKSRLLNEVAAGNSNDVIVAKLNFSSEGIKRLGLLSSLRSESRRLRKVLMKRDSPEVWRLNLLRFKAVAKRIVPAAGTAIPYLGQFTSRALDVALEDQDPKEESYSSWITHFLSVCGHLSTFGPVVIAIDDYHNLSGDEQSYLSELLAQLVESDAPELRAIIAARPYLIRRQSGHDGLTTAFQRAAKNGELVILKLEPLKREFLTEISDGIFTNPSESGPLVELASGSPQRLQELLIKLNINGDLHSTQNRITLPEQVGQLTYLTEDLWTQISKNKLGLDIASLLAVGPSSIDVGDLDLFAKCLQVAFSDVIRAASALQSMRILHLAGDSGSPRAELRFSHDTLRDQIATRLRSENTISYIYFHEMSSRLITSLLAKHLGLGPREFDTSQLPDLLDTEALDLLTIRAVNLREGRVRGWEDAATDTAARCFSSGRVHSTIQLLEPAIAFWNRVLKPRAPTILGARELLVKAHYKLANYQTVVQLSESLPTEDASVAYAVALSTVIEKGVDWFPNASRLLQPAIESKAMIKYRPLLRSALAIANRERNQVELGEGILREIVTNGQGQTDDHVWHQFLAVAAVYLDKGRAEACAAQAFEFFSENGEIRAAGIAATNLSVLAVRRHKIDEALHYCEVSEDLLRQAGSGDVVFPITNRAALYLSIGEAREPLPLLQSCLFRRLPREYELTVMVDLALAQWANEKTVDLAPIQRLREANRNTWLEWLAAFNCAFLALDGGRISSSAEKVRRLYLDILAADPGGRASAFWNSLIAKIDGGRLLPEFKMHEKANVERSPLQELADPTTSIGRPIFLSFGHI